MNALVIGASVYAVLTLGLILMYSIFLGKRTIEYIKRMVYFAVLFLRADYVDHKEKVQLIDNSMNEIDRLFESEIRHDDTYQNA